MSFSTTQILLLVTPFIVLHLVLLLLAIRDLLRPDRRVRGGSKPLWALVIVLVNAGVGPIIYFLAGRENE